LFVRTLAIDLGARRVGLALSDEGGRFATPLDVFTVSSPEQAAAEVLKVVAKESPQRLVVGLPLNMDDSVGPAAKQTIAWAKRLGEDAKLPVIFIDERLSSFAAEQHLADRKRGGERMTRQMKKERLDAIAAAGFLQAFLDGNLVAIDVDPA
jgi:putative Holliday junction resolvase